MPGILIFALIVVGVLYAIGFSFIAALSISALAFGLVFLLAWLADKDLVRLWHVAVFLIVCFVGSRSCSYVISERHLHQPLAVMPGIQVKPILSPEDFPSIPELDESQFDVASDGSVIFRKQDQLIALSGAEQSLAVLAEEPGLSSFILDSGGTLLTMNRGVLGQFNPTQPPLPLTTWQKERPQIDLADVSVLAMAQVGRGRGSGSGSLGPVGPTGGSGYRGGGGFSGSDSRITISDTFHWFFKPTDDLVSESLGSPPPPLSAGAYTYTILAHAPARLPAQPQPLQLLPDPEMRLARGGAAGEVLVFGGQNSGVARELHRIYSDGSAQWVVNAANPIRFAAEGHGQLYIVTIPASQGSDPPLVQHWKIIHLPLGTKDINHPELVFSSDRLPGDASIQSFALSESGKTLFFSVPNRVYAIHGPLVVKIIEGMSGILRTHGESLYIFNAKRKALLSVTGFE